MRPDGAVVENVRAGVGEVRNTVAVDVIVLAGIANAVGAGVGLVRVRIDRAVVAKVAEPVNVGIDLSRVVDEGTIVGGVRNAVAVDVVEVVLVRLTIAVGVAVLVVVVNAEVAVAPRHREDVIAVVRGGREDDRAAEESGAAGHRGQGVQLGVREKDQAALRRYRNGIAVGDHLDLDAVADSGGTTRRVGSADRSRRRASDALQGRGSRIVVKDGDLDALVALEEIGAIGRDGGALVTGRLAGTTEAGAGRGVGRGEPRRLVRRMVFLPLEDHVVDRLAVVGRGRRALDGPEADANLPAVTGTARVEEEVILLRGRIDDAGVSALITDEGDIQVADRTCDVVGGRGAGATTRADRRQRVAGGTG